jgi:hypothetical protein
MEAKGQKDGMRWPFQWAPDQQRNTLCCAASEARGGSGVFLRHSLTASLTLGLLGCFLAPFRDESSTAAIP